MQQLLIRIEANVPWKCFLAKGGNWVGVCDPLSLTVQSDTYASLMEEIGEALNAIFKDLLESQELPRFLQRHGWSPITPIPQDPSEVRFDIPFSAQRVSSYGSQTAIH